MTRPALRYSDLFVGALLVVVIAGLGINARALARETSGRAMCASNLHQIGLGILLYQNDNNQFYPRAIAGDTNQYKPTWGTPYATNPKLGAVKDADPFGGKDEKPSPNDVTAAFYLLLTNEKLTSRVFTCPDTALRGSSYGKGNANDYTNWMGNRGLAAHLSYGYQNPYPSNEALAAGFSLRNPDSTFAVAADMSPGGDAVTKVTLNAPAGQMRAANSLNHGGDGQNVLYGDGHAEWQTTPFCGTSHDNIFTSAGPELQEPGRGTAVVLASPVSPSDSILLPTAADVGYKPRAVDDKPLSAEARAALAAKMVGTYEAFKDKMVIDAAHLTVTSEDESPTVFTYTVLGGTGDTLVLKLTTGDQVERATVIVDDQELWFTLPEDEKTIKENWVREASPAKP